VVLGQVGFPRASTSDGILTVTGDQTAYIAGARWVAPARVLFQEAVQRAFQAKSRRLQLINVGDVGPAGAVLNLQVTSFEARYASPGAAPTAAVAVSARMTASDGRYLDQRTFAASVPAGANSVSAIVSAFDQADDQVLTQLIGWADGQAAAATSGAGSSGGPATVTTTATQSTSTSTTTAPR
jgi:cholesterol transport system auxiliary component